MDIPYSSTKCLTVIWYLVNAAFLQVAFPVTLFAIQQFIFR
jgi:hypothetical protein